MNIQTIWESIELDKRQLKCLIDSFQQQPDAELQSLLKRNIELLQSDLAQLSACVASVVCHEEESEIAAVVIEPAELIAEEIKEEVVCETLQVEDEPADEVESTEPISVPLSLNDTFRFAREWFDGDTDRLNLMWDGFSSCSTFAEAEAWLKSQIGADEEDETLLYCLFILKQYYPVV